MGDRGTVASAKFFFETTFSIFTMFCIAVFLKEIAQILHGTWHVAVVNLSGS